MDQRAYSDSVWFITGLDRRYKRCKRVGWLYIAHNPAMGARALKIGMSGRPPDRRVSELSTSTGYEGNFSLLYFVHVSDRVEAEKWVHRSLDCERIKSWEEFFDISLGDACDMLDAAADRFPVMMGLPGRFQQKGPAGALPQALRKWRMVCHACDTLNAVREFATPARARCSACGAELRRG